MNDVTIVTRYMWHAKLHRLPRAFQSFPKDLAELLTLAPLPPGVALRINIGDLDEPSTATSFNLDHNTRSPAWLDFNHAMELEAQIDEQAAHFDVCIWSSHMSIGFSSICGAVTVVKYTGSHVKIWSGPQQVNWFVDSASRTSMPGERAQEIKMFFDTYAATALFCSDLPLLDMFLIFEYLPHPHELAQLRAHFEAEGIRVGMDAHVYDRHEAANRIQCAYRCFRLRKAVVRIQSAVRGYQARAFLQLSRDLAPGCGAPVYLGGLVHPPGDGFRAAGDDFQATCMATSAKV
jgi:hypothetical protein